LLRRDASIFFAHRTFKWSNEGRGVAGVHCVIIGFSLSQKDPRYIFDYANPGAEPLRIRSSNINPYLVDAPNILLRNQSRPLCSVPSIAFGSMANDGGYLILSTDEKDELIRNYPAASSFVRPLIGGEELLKSKVRWCLWLQNVEPPELRKIPPVLERIAAVRAIRLKSKRRETRALADTPALFGEIRQPTASYLAIPEVSSESRPYIPLAFLSKDVIATHKLYTMANALLYHFGVLQSNMHMAWVRQVAGRLESRYQYSAGIVYNNFPWPVDATEKQKKAIEEAAQKVLDAREQFPDSSLADLYDPLTMPPVLVKAHQTLDKAVDAAYGKRTFTSDADREAFLFEQYQKLVSPLMVGDGKSKKATQKK
jgi:hypothetical protein